MLCAEMSSYFANILVLLSNVCEQSLPCLVGGMVSLVWNECGGFQQLSKLYSQATCLGQHNDLICLDVCNSSVLNYTI